MNIRRAIAADAPAMVEIERACRTAAHWTLQQYAQAMGAGGSSLRLCLVAEAGPISAIAGFLVARRVEREWELENIVVAPDSRRTGLGKRLLTSLVAEVCQTNGECVFLEVRESNHAARRLYEKMGFKQTGRRAAYYSSPQEDAVLYQWENSRKGRS